MELKATQIGQIGHLPPINGPIPPTERAHSEPSEPSLTDFRALNKININNIVSRSTIESVNGLRHSGLSDGDDGQNGAQFGILGVFRPSTGGDIPQQEPQLRQLRQHSQQFKQQMRSPRRLRPEASSYPRPYPASPTACRRPHPHYNANIAPPGSPIHNWLVSCNDEFYTRYGFSVEEVLQVINNGCDHFAKLIQRPSFQTEIMPLIDQLPASTLQNTPPSTVNDVRLYLKEYCLERGLPLDYLANCTPSMQSSNQFTSTDSVSVRRGPNYNHLTTLSPDLRHPYPHPRPYSNQMPNNSYFGPIRASPRQRTTRKTDPYRPNGHARSQSPNLITALNEPMIDAYNFRYLDRSKVVDSVVATIELCSENFVTR